MPDFIIRKRTEKIFLDRWENEGGSLPCERTDKPAELFPGKRIKEKNDKKSTVLPDR